VWSIYSSLLDSRTGVWKRLPFKSLCGVSMQNPLRSRTDAGPPAPISATSTDLADLCTAEAFQEENHHLFSTPISFRWLLRRHRPFLVERGAVVELAGRIYVVRSRMGPALLEIGRLAMQHGRGRERSSVAGEERT